MTSLLILFIFLCSNWSNGIYITFSRNLLKPILATHTWWYIRWVLKNCLFHLLGTLYLIMCIKEINDLPKKTWRVQTFTETSNLVSASQLKNSGFEIQMEKNHIVGNCDFRWKSCKNTKEMLSRYFKMAGKN